MGGLAKPRSNQAAPVAGFMAGAQLVRGRRRGGPVLPKRNDDVGRNNLTNNCGCLDAAPTSGRISGAPWTATPSLSRQPMESFALHCDGKHTVKCRTDRLSPDQLNGVGQQIVKLTGFPALGLQSPNCAVRRVRRTLSWRAEKSEKGSRGRGDTAPK